MYAQSPSGYCTLNAHYCWESNVIAMFSQYSTALLPPIRMTYLCYVSTFMPSSSHAIVPSPPNTECCSHLYKQFPTCLQLVSFTTSCPAPVSTVCHSFVSDHSSKGLHDIVLQDHQIDDFPPVYVGSDITFDATVEEALLTV